METAATITLTLGLIIAAYGLAASIRELTQTLTDFHQWVKTGGFTRDP